VASRADTLERLVPGDLHAGDRAAAETLELHLARYEFAARQARAGTHYAAPRLRFQQADAMAWSDAEGFDTIVSLETIEHLPEPGAFFARLEAMLRPQGVLVASVPTTPSVDLNPHHLHDFTARSFRRMGARHGLQERAALRQVQRLPLLEPWRGQRFRRAQLRANLPAWYLRHPGALLRRVGSVLRHGLANHYLTLAWQKLPE
jgi:SAM-dependent methyltransferase